MKGFQESDENKKNKVNRNNLVLFNEASLNKTKLFLLTLFFLFSSDS